LKINFFKTVVSFTQRLKAGFSLKKKQKAALKKFFFYAEQLELDISSSAVSRQKLLEFE